MNCQDVERVLDDHRQAALTSVDRDELDRHLAVCEDCAWAWHSSQVLGRLREAEAPAPRPALLRESVEHATRYARRAAQRSFWWGASVGGALAAGLVLVAILLIGPNPAGPVDSIPRLTMALNETRNVSVAIDSARPLSDVRVRVLLAGGIRLENFEDRSVVDWSTDLDVGLNRLTLPLVALHSAGGELLVEIEHEEKRKVFAVRIDVAERDYVKNPEPFGSLSV